MDVSYEVVGCTEIRLERRLAVTATKNVAVRGDDHFDQSGCGPVFTEQASEDRLKVFADLDGTELTVQSCRIWPGSRMAVSSVMNSACLPRPK